MSDEALRGFERAARAAKDDALVWVRYVRALDQGGAPVPDDLAAQVRRVRACMDEAPWLATIEVGDEVWVEEHETPWVLGRWRGIVRACFIEKEPAGGKEFLRFRVRPILEDETGDLPWRVRPNPDQLARGLELGRADRLELIARPG